MTTTLPLWARAHARVVGRVLRPLRMDVQNDLKIGATLRKLRENEHLPSDELNRRALTALRGFLADMREHAPFHARLPELPERDEDLPKWLQQQPILGRSDLQDHEQQLRHRRPTGRVDQSGSGGTSGMPVRFVIDHHAVGNSLAQELHWFEWGGYRQGDPVARIWGHPVETMHGSQGWRALFMRWLLNERVFDAFTLDPVKVERYVGELNRFRPTVILGYAGALWDFARMAQAAGLKVQAPRAVFASGEPLRDDMRPLIESVFGAPVFNRYGTRELTAVACECEAHQGMHYDPTRIWLEIAREDGSPSQPGEEGDVIATLLTNTAQGFIRYRIGDRATVAEPGPCPCGRTLPRIAGVTGRSVDTLTATDGRCVSPILFLQMIGGYRNRGVLSRMQLVQDRRDHVTVRVVLAPGQSAASTQETFGDIGEVLATGLGRDMQIDIDVVDDLPTSGSGKFRYVLNQIETQTDPRR